MKRLVLLTALFIVPLAVTLPAASPIAAYASTSSCTPKVDDPPHISGGYGYAHGYTINCSGSDSFTYEVRFATSTGTVLATSDMIGPTNGGNVSAYAPLLGGSVYCGGRMVHAFMYININGTVKSTQTPNYSC